MIPDSPFSAKVDLGLSLDFPALIVSAPTGVTYAQQACGVACLHPKLEGFLIPLTDELGKAKEALESHFREKPYEEGGMVRFTIDGVSYVGVSPKTADWLDEQVLPLWVRVDRQRLHDSYEAWIWVNITSDPHPDIPELVLDRERPGVLVWLNSD